MKNYPSTPELDKMLAVKDKSQAIGEFFDWLVNDKGYVLSQYEEKDRRLYPTYSSIEKLLAEFFGIDLKKIEEERRAILKSLDSSN